MEFAPKAQFRERLCIQLKVKVMRKKNNILCIAMLVGLLCGCGKKYQYIPKDIETVEVEIVRFDSAQLAVRTDM